MSTTVIGVSLDTTDSAELAGFWAGVLGLTVNAGATSEYAAIESTPRLAFHRVPEGKVAKNRLHLDLLSDEFDLELKRLLGLGATRVNELRQGGAHWITLADPEGNEFDLIAG
jgi:catechol-2,3-dioxygenase